MTSSSCDLAELREFAILAYWNRRLARPRLALGENISTTI